MPLNGTSFFPALKVNSCRRYREPSRRIARQVTDKLPSALRQLRDQFLARQLLGPPRRGGVRPAAVSTRRRAAKLEFARVQKAAVRQHQAEQFAAELDCLAGFFVAQRAGQKPPLCLCK